MLPQAALTFTLETILSQDRWLLPSQNISLPAGEVHVWRADFRLQSASVQTLFSRLSPDEQERADKFVFNKDRGRFIISRAALRQILGGYLNVSPEQIRFTCNQYGKPQLDSNDNLICFNASHSQNVGLYAFARGREVGVDVEFINEEFAGLEVAGRFFSPDEIAALNNLPQEQRTAAFFSCWTRKEAFIKAVGQGLSFPLNEFTVSVNPAELKPLLSTNDLQKARNWSLLTLFPHPGYASALAVEGAVETLRLYQWTESEMFQ